MRQEQQKSKIVTAISTALKDATRISWWNAIQDGFFSQVAGRLTTHYSPGEKSTTNWSWTSFLLSSCLSHSFGEKNGRRDN